MNTSLNRDKIQNYDTEYVVACFSRGRIFSEHRTTKGAQKKLAKYPALEEDDYAIYSRREWSLGYVEPQLHSMWI
jgi:hypothetical protein